MRKHLQEDFQDVNCFKYNGEKKLCLNLGQSFNTAISLVLYIYKYLFFYFLGYRLRL